MTVADVDAIRGRFPALARRDRGVQVAYFDGPGGTQVPAEVADAVGNYLLHHNANTHWAYPTSEETDTLLLEARRVLGDFLHAEPDEIAFGLNMTTLTFHLARALGRAWGRGDEVIVTELDHHGNVAPWEALARERGITLRVVPFRVDDGTLDLVAYRSFLGERTRLVALGAASNALGTVTDVAALAADARAAGALVFVDAVHSAPHLLQDVRAIGCDFLACSAYKFYGPHVGVLFTRRDLLDRLDLPRVGPAPNEGPERLETGTQNHEGIVGAAAAVEFLAGLAGGPGSRRERLSVAFTELHRRGSVRFRRLWDGLGTLPGIRRYGPGPETARTPTAAFTVHGMTSEAVARRLGEGGVYLSHGDFYAATVVERLGLAKEGLVRAGCACYTDDEEVDRLIESLARLRR